MTSYPPLTADQLAAVRSYIDSLSPKRRRTWKAHLELDWYNARLSGPIHSLRNTHGFEWLAKFRLPPEG
jgi:hypothetical protein